MNIFTGLFAITIAIGCLWFSLKFLRLYFKVKNWERVKAKVLSKEITVHEKYSTSRTPYKLNATYTYNYKNIMYKGHFIYLAELAGGQVNHLKSDADKRLDRIEDSMNIYVNPLNPKESVMYCEGALLYSFVFAMGAMAMLFGIFNLF
jgi:hypothetical protein